MNNTKKILGLSAVGTGLSTLALDTFAAGQDFSALSGAVDFSTVATAIMAVATAVVGVYVVIRGAKWVSKFI